MSPLPQNRARRVKAGVIAALLWLLAGCSPPRSPVHATRPAFALDYDTPVDPALQARVEAIDADLRGRLGMEADATAVGLLDLRQARLALIHPDRIQYAASVPKIGILLAWFDAHPEAAAGLDPATRHALGLMIKVSSNEMATRFSREVGLARVQAVLDRYGLYDARHGGGLWMGKHYGESSERQVDPVGGHSHAATVRQVLRFFLWLEQDRLVSPAASARMREVFASPEIPHDPIKFVEGLSGRPVEILRKSGSWEEWLHDAAVVAGPGRHYILVGLTQHRRGDDYLAGLAAAVDDAMVAGP